MVDFGSMLGGVSKGVSTTGAVLQYVFYGLVIGALLYLVWLFLSYNVRVNIREKTGKGFIIVQKKGKFVPDKNNPQVQNFVMMKDKRWNFPLDRSYVEMQKKMFGTLKIVNFVEDEKGRLQPVKAVEEENIVKWKGWTPESSEFYIRNMKEVIDRFKKGDWWSKYGALIQIGALALVFVMAIVLFRQIGEVSDQLGSIATALQSVADATRGIPSNATTVITG